MDLMLGEGHHHTSGINTTTHWDLGDSLYVSYGTRESPSPILGHLICISLAYVNHIGTEADE